MHGRTYRSQSNKPCLQCCDRSGRVLGNECNSVGRRWFAREDGTFWRFLLARSLGVRRSWRLNTGGQHRGYASFLTPDAQLFNSEELAETRHHAIVSLRVADVSPPRDLDLNGAQWLE